MELMSESEPLDTNVKAAETALAAEKQQVETEKRQARERTAADQKSAQELQGERGELVAKVNPGLYRQYERSRKSRQGIAMAEAVDGRCTACYMTMRPQHFLDLKKGDTVLLCENCQRILFYNPPATVEDLAGEAAPVVHE